MSPSFLFIFHPTPPSFSSTLLYTDQTERFIYVVEVTFFNFLLSIDSLFVEDLL